mgnify:CR=1 FL=1
MGAMRQIKGVICILISIVMCWSASAANNKRYVNIVFIGIVSRLAPGYRSLSMMRLL